MKNTGIIRKVDDLGRVVIPKEIRKNLGIGEGTPLELYVEEGNVILKKYRSSIDEKEEIAKEWAANNSLNFYQTQYRIECTTVYCEAIVHGDRKIGVAKIADGDEFSPLVGMVIANCRATGRKIPKELLE